ncbi:MAG: hypothetical protein JSR33_11015, partial [Proteobacteria bacterium]|nr:hypothetical protein [Pseudomonadota bacterium]
MHDIMYNLNNKKLNLKDLAKGLDERYKKYQEDYKDKKNSSRAARDKEFVNLLTQYKENEKKSEEKMISSFYALCKFYAE